MTEKSPPASIKISTKELLPNDAPLFNLGFRPFFLCAGIFALVLVGWWSIILGTGISSPDYYGSVLWHSHEMVFGYAAAVIAGFLLTAVRNWTGIDTLTGRPLAGLALLWLAGRLTALFSTAFPEVLVFIVDFSFLPLLIAALASPILKTKKYKNLAFIVLLLVMTTGNLLIHLESLGVTAAGAMEGIKLALGSVLTMIVMIAGRVFPFFTERALEGATPARNPTLDKMCTLLVAAVLPLDTVWPYSKVVGVISIGAAALNGIRLTGWYSPSVARVPMLWILYLGYLWIILGLILLGLSPFAFLPVSIAIHAFTVGGIGAVTLGMMARVSLGHTGRTIVAVKPTIIAFVLMNTAALVRVIFPLFLPAQSLVWIQLSGGLWMSAFGLFLYVYSPILIAPRVDHT